MPRTDTRARMVGAALDLLRQRGATAVTVDAVLAASGAPRGSVYHHFPGGRDEIVLVAARAGADYLTGVLDAAVDDGDSAVELLDAFVALWMANLRLSDYQAGCPITALAVDSRDDLPAADDLVRETFEAWRARIAQVLRLNGRTGEQADAAATLAVAAVEGAVVLCRVNRSTAPLEQVAELLRGVFATPTDATAARS